MGKSTETESGLVVEGGCGEGKIQQLLIGRAFLFMGMERFWTEVVVMVTQHGEYN